MYKCARAFVIFQEKNERRNTVDAKSFEATENLQ